MNIKMLYQFLIVGMGAICVASALAQDATTAKPTKAPAAAAATKTTAAPPKTVDPSTIPDDAFFLTDVNWQKGVALRWAGFFVKNTPENAALYVKGNTVVLPNGDKRTITETAVTNAPFLEVRVSGDVLKSADVGLPSKFKVIVNTDKKPTTAPEAAKPAASTTAKPAAGTTSKNTSAK
jgi:hypothetical protein